MSKWTDGVRGLLVHAGDKDEMERRMREERDERWAQREVPTMMTSRQDPWDPRPNRSRSQIGTFSAPQQAGGNLVAAESRSSPPTSMPVWACVIPPRQPRQPTTSLGSGSLDP
jgi:hypothetical protein